MSPAEIKTRLERRAFRLFKRTVQELRILGRKKDPRCILVVGVQRSGTSMVMELFDRGLDYAVYSDNDGGVFDNFCLRPLEDVRRIVDAAPAPYVVMKPMTEMYKLRSLFETFPDSRAIWLYRSMEDVVNSHVRLWTGMPESMKRIKADRSWNDWRAGGISDEVYDIIQRYVHDDMDNATACALFWYIRNIQFFEQGYDRDQRVFLLPYDRFVRNPWSSFERLFQAMAIPLTSRMTMHIHARSIRKNAGPDVAANIRKLCDELSRRFDKVIAELDYANVVPPEADG